MSGLLVGTGILWFLNLAIVGPLATSGLKRKMVAAGLDPESDVELTEGQQTYWSGEATKQYILYDVIVLAAAGLIGGLLGYYFIGVTLESKGWPGMIAFILSSFLGIGMRS